LRIYKKLILTYLPENILFKRPFKDYKVPSSINTKYYLNKLIFIWLSIKKISRGAK